MEKKTVGIILAGGTGGRMKEETPKQFLALAGKPVIIHAIDKFDKCDLISDLVIVCHQEHIEKLKRIIKENGIGKVYGIVPGGRTRQESSFIGVKNCPAGTGTVLIHDAVRPFVDERMIRDVLNSAEDAGASGPVIDTEDTIIVQKDGFIESIPDRKDLKRIQTPQGFRYEVISAAHERALENGITDYTDDCGMVLEMGKPVKVVKGAECNIKITISTDLFLAKKLLQSIREGPLGTGGRNRKMT